MTTTTDWTQKMEEATKQWTDVQKQLWTNWGTATQQASSNVQAKAMWQQLLGNWKAALYQMLDMQVETARLWSESVTSAEVLDGMTPWAEQSYQMTRQWSTMQKQLWDNWFQMAEKMDPTQMPSMPNMAGVDMSGQPFAKMWEDMSKQAISMQQEWTKTWASWQPTKKG